MSCRSRARSGKSVEVGPVADAPVRSVCVPHSIGARLCARPLPGYGGSILGPRFSAEGGVSRLQMRPWWPAAPAGRGKSDCVSERD